MSDDFTDATEVLKNLFDRLIPENSSEYTGLFSGWEEIVGPDMSMHVFLKDVMNGSLILEADHPGWIQKTRMIQSDILGKVRQKYPELEIKKLKISVGNGRQTSNPIPVKKPPVQVVQQSEETTEITPSVASDENSSTEERKFHNLLEKIRRYGDS